MSGNFPKSALEQYVEGSADLAPEEAEVMVDEADQNARAAAAGVEQARRLIETASVLEDLAVVATRIERATPTEVRLIENVSDMAAAGTNIAPQNFIPSMESFIGGVLAMESVVDKAKKIVEVVLAHLAKIWQAITDFFKLAFVIPNMIKIVKERMAILKNLGEPRKGTTEVKFEQKLSAIQIDGRIPFVAPIAGGKKATLTMATLNACLADWNTSTEYVYEKYLKNVAVSGANIVSALESFDFANPTKTGDTLEAKLRANVPDQLPKSKTSKPIVEDDIVYTQQTGAVLFGNVQLVLDNVINTTQAKTTIDALNAYKKISLQLEDAPSQAPDDSIDFITMELLDKEEITDLLKAVHGLLSGMSDFYVGSEFRAVNSVRTNLERAAKRAAANSSKVEDDGHGGAVPLSTAEEYYSTIVNYSLVFTGWVQNPTIEMYRKTINIARTLITVTDAHMRAYELKS